MSQHTYAQQGEHSHTPISSTLIVLSLRPDGAKFNGNRIERAQEAGFDWLTNGAHCIGYSSPDTGHEIARHVINNTDEAFGQLSEIQIHVDPTVCAFQLNAGTALLRMLQRYAILIGAHLCDSMGKPMDGAQLDSVARHIDAVSDGDG